MKNVILIDGNNILYRSYYATAYSGTIMKNSKGFPTNALFGFVNMLNKIIKEENPHYMVVALDKGKTFRHASFEGYKEGRLATPDELKQQFPIAKDILTNMGIRYYEADNYEADDIIGTIANMIDRNDEYKVTIISSDKDLLQLITDDVKVKLLKQKDHIIMDRNTFFNEYGLEPIKMIDLKGLQGDPSDNIPGVKGIGEKTALTLLKEYGSIEGVYAAIDNINGKLKEKLLNDKDMAFMSKSLATIYKEVPLNITFNDFTYNKPNYEELNKLFEELEFYSLLKKNEVIKKEDKMDIKIIKDINDINIEGNCAIYLEILGTNYHKSTVLGMGIYNDNISCYIPIEILKQNPKFLMDNIKYTYDYKKLLVSLKWLNINITNVSFDTMVAAYLLNYNIKDDISYLAKTLEYDISFYENVYGKENKYNEINENIIATNCINKAKFIYETYDKFNSELKTEDMLDLFNNIEMPLVETLADMEYTGIEIDNKELNNMGINIKEKIDVLTTEIHSLAGVEFNIASPKQLADILFDKLNLKANKKRSTDKDVLDKLKDMHPIVPKLLEYRLLVKLFTTYIEGLKNYILSDGKIHTIYNQTLTRTGRLSSVEPNLQNIPMRYEEGRLLRKCFIPSNNSLLMSADYSQIELRILAHISKAKNLIEAFNNDMDIHTKTAMDIFNVNKEDVTKDMRRTAKAVNFGIVYGISSFGLSENLDIDVFSAKNFIDKYLDTFPGIKEYMDFVIKDAKEKGYVLTVMNRKRTIDELYNPNYMIRMQGERMALNTPIQGSSADIIKKAMNEIYQEFNDKKLKSKMILQVHDELVFDVKEEEKDIVIKIVTHIMENTYKLDVPLRIELDFGKNWYEAK
jgi:DNA polymerase I